MLQQNVQRFQVPDIDRHGGWLIKRMHAAYPHINEQMLPGWLRNIVYDNEFLFLSQDNSVALAQSVRPDPFTHKLVVWERFVWAQDPSHVAEAALFYERFKVWAKQLGADSIVVGEQSDVPRELIKTALGTLLERKQTYCRV